MKKVTYIILAVGFVGALVAGSIVFPKLAENFNNSSEIIDEKKDEDDVKLASDFTFLDKDDNQIKLSSLIGKPVIVNFWATWCTYCEQELPTFNKIYEEYKDRIHFLIVDLPYDNGETKAIATKYIEDNKYSFPLYFDYEKTGYNAYECYSIPRTVFVNKDGTLRRLFVGMITEASIRLYIDMMLS